MVLKKNVRSYFSVISENIKNDSRILIPDITISASDDVSQAEVDMAK